MAASGGGKGGRGKKVIAEALAPPAHRRVAPPEFMPMRKMPKRNLLWYNPASGAPPEFMPRRKMPKPNLLWYNPTN